MKYSSIRKTILLAGLLSPLGWCPQHVLAVESPLAAYAPAAVIQGQVSDAQGPIIGANVHVKGEPHHGVVTDMDGHFTLDAAPGSTLVVSYVGYLTKEVKATTEPMHIFLEEDNNVLNEVVVIGYGTQRRENVTGSVANIGGEKLNQVAATNAAYALQGRVAGVNMTQTSSQPGAEMQIRIRGQRSLNASNDPLIVLDGIPFMGKLSDINPSDIKSMDILKDASATAIYGSRGANGVIIITTEKGTSATQARVTYNGYAGFKKIFKKYPMMNGSKFAQMREYAGLYTNSLDESDDIDTDWQDMFYRTGSVQSHSVTVNGGTNGGSYSFGAGWYNDEAVIPTQGYTRYNIRATLDQNVGKYLRFGLNINTNYREMKGTQVGLYGILSKSPIINPYNEDGSLKRTVNMPIDQGQYVWTRSVLEELEDLYLREDKGLGTYNTMYGEIKCPWIDGLSYRINIGLNYRSSKTGAFTGTGIDSSNANQPNSASVAQEITKNWVVENILSYDKQFGKHSINLTGLYSAERTYFERTYMAGRDIPAEYFQYFQIGAAQQDLAVSPGQQNYWESGLMSWMGRAIYTYDNRYMATVAFRSDGSSRLAKGHQWHTYPAVSLGWNIAHEEFMDGVKWLNSLKLRVGYGETSNQSISPYSTLGALSTKYYNFCTNMATGYYVSTLPNPELGWEYSSTWNFGVDYSLFNSRLWGTFEYYVQNTHDLLLSVSLPEPSGVKSYMANIGRTRNLGWELSVNGTILDDLDGWTWDAGINLYSNHNKLVELASGSKEDVANRWFVGHPIDVIYDYKKIGLWQQGEEELLNILEPGGNIGMIKVEYTGDYDENGLPTRQIDTSDRQIMDMEPDLMGGFNTTVTYRNFDLTVIGAFQVGGKLISTIHSSNGYLNMLSGRRGQLDVDYWTEDNPNAKYPKPGGLSSNDNPVYGSTLGYFDASYLKIRTITLGYNFANLRAIRDMGISSLRAYASVQNPFVLFSPYTRECGLDPETNTISSNGGTMAVTLDGYQGAHVLPVVGYNTPATRNFIFGVNITF